MANMYDYFRWRGDLSILQDGFNELDNLVLSYFSYVQVDQIFETSPKDMLTIREISDLFFEIHAQEELDQDRSFIKSAPYVMREMAKTVRYKDLLVGHYINEVDVEQNLQFSAMEIILPDKTSFVAYRGTDDSIIGWKEDFYLSTMQVNAQKKAVEYLNKIGKKRGKLLRVGGHSKGGNLAIYAAATCNKAVKERILAIYCNDGPGFHKDFIESQDYLSVEDRIHRYIPEECIIGMLMHHTRKPVIIQSNAKNIMQHDPLSWQMEGAQFLYADDVTAAAKVAKQSIESWLESIPNEERAPFVEDVFSVLEAPGAETLTELYRGGIHSIQAMVKQMNQLSPDTREKISQLFNGYMFAWGEVIKGRHRNIFRLDYKDYRRADLLEAAYDDELDLEDEKKYSLKDEYRKLKGKLEEKIEGKIEEKREEKKAKEDEDVHLLS